MWSLYLIGCPTFYLLIKMSRAPKVWETLYETMPLTCAETLRPTLIKHPLYTRHNAKFLTYRIISKNLYGDYFYNTISSYQWGNKSQQCQVKSIISRRQDWNPPAQTPKSQHITYNSGLYCILNNGDAQRWLAFLHIWISNFSKSTSVAHLLCVSHSCVFCYKNHSDTQGCNNHVCQGNLSRMPSAFGLGANSCFPVPRWDS